MKYVLTEQSPIGEERVVKEFNTLEEAMEAQTLLRSTLSEEWLVQIYTAPKFKMMRKYLRERDIDGRKSSE